MLGWVILYWFGVSSFNAPCVVRHQAFYLLLRPRLCVISHSYPLVLLTRGRVHTSSNSFVIKKWERTCALMEGGNTCSVALFRVCSPQAYQMWRLGETVLTDDCLIEYKLCQTAFQGDCSVNTNRRKRSRMKEICNVRIWSCDTCAIQNSHIYLSSLAKLLHTLG